MKKIVLVDDNIMFLGVIKEYFEFREFKCVTFYDPNDALQYILSNNDIYAIISDFEMPQMDGLTLAKKVKEKCPSMHIFIMSGHDRAYVKRKALREAITDDTFKIYSKSHMEDIVEELKK